MKNINEKLLKAVESNKIEEVKRLIEEGADVNVVDEDGETALLCASHWARIVTGKQIGRASCRERV